MEDLETIMQKRDSPVDEIDKLRDFITFDESTGMPNRFDLRYYPQKAFSFASSKDPRFFYQFLEAILPRTDLTEQEKQVLRTKGFRLLNEDYKNFSDSDLDTKVKLKSWIMDNLSDDELKNVGVSWMENADPSLIDLFRQNVLRDMKRGFNFSRENLHERPAYELLRYIGDVNNQWCIRFTSNARAIANRGFLYGAPGLLGIGCTRGGQNNLVRKMKKPGFNFGFLCTDPGLKDYADKYSQAVEGFQAVVFPLAKGIAAYHKDDKEDQVIFYGPDIKADDIFPIVYHKKENIEEIVHWQQVTDDKRRFSEEGWYVPLDGDEQIYAGETIEDAIGYVQSHHIEIRDRAISYKEFQAPLSAYSYQRPSVEKMREKLSDAFK